ncbi:MAG: A/G-specific adenine glycosylase [Treponemataceae bacterium]
MDHRSIIDFHSTVIDHYRQSGRTFPWRQTTDPWAILVSEIMLQQTQTDRVVPYWRRWLELWPSPTTLAAAPLDQVLREWSGLGYNRRSRFLRDAAAVIRDRHDGIVPDDPEALDALPGIGPYTARAVATFAFGRPEVFIETNIRAVYLHFFFPNESEVNDSRLMPLIEETLDRSDPRCWYWALMDYGAALKRVTVNPGRRSAHHVRQSRFEGSLRQARGAALRSLASEGSSSIRELSRRTGISDDRLAAALSALADEGMVAEKAGVYEIA